VSSTQLSATSPGAWRVCRRCHGGDYRQTSTTDVRRRVQTMSPLRSSPASARDGTDTGGTVVQITAAISTRRATVFFSRLRRHASDVRVASQLLATAAGAWRRTHDVTIVVAARLRRTSRRCVHVCGCSSVDEHHAHFGAGSGGTACRLLEPISLPTPRLPLAARPPPR